MTPTLAGLIVIVFTFGGALFGRWLRRALPDEHLGSAVFLILEMDGPFDGILRVSLDQILHALGNMGR